MKTIKSIDFYWEKKPVKFVRVHTYEDVDRCDVTFMSIWNPWLQRQCASYAFIHCNGIMAAMIWSSIS